MNVVYDFYFHPMAHVNGPFLARFTETWKTFRSFRGTWHEDIIMLHRTYGNIVRIAPNEISFIDAVALKKLYGPGTHASKVGT